MTQPTSVFLGPTVQCSIEERTRCTCEPCSIALRGEATFWKAFISLCSGMRPHKTSTFGSTERRAILAAPQPSNSVRYAAFQMPPGLFRKVCEWPTPLASKNELLGLVSLPNSYRLHPHEWLRFDRSSKPHHSHVNLNLVDTTTMRARDAGFFIWYHGIFPLLPAPTTGHTYQDGFLKAPRDSLHISN